MAHGHVSAEKSFDVYESDFSSEEENNGDNDDEWAPGHCEDDVSSDESDSEEPIWCSQESDITVVPLNDSQESDIYDGPLGESQESDITEELARCPLEKQQKKRAHSQDDLHLNISPRKKQRMCKPVVSHRWVSTWKTETEADTNVPPSFKFTPKRDPGQQLSASDNYTPLQLFKLFFTEEAVDVLCRNTNKAAARSKAGGAKYKWTDISRSDFYQYIGLVFYMALMKLDKVYDYWRTQSIFSLSFPAQVMTRERYSTISWNLHMSDPDEDKENDRKKGTPLYDQLFRVKPLMETIQSACRSFYHPRRNIAIDERMVPCKGITSLKQCMKKKKTKWGIKLFVLADSSNGYTVDFNVFTGKNPHPSGQGFVHDLVMSLVDKEYLGSGYHIYMDNFFTRPKLFKHLFDMKFGACGTFRDTKLFTKGDRGAIRWGRDGPLLFVKWMEKREVTVCSTIHAAYRGDTVERRVRDHSGAWVSETLACPMPVKEYNKYMGGVDLSNQLIHYYSAQHKTYKWYKKLFLQFLDIAGKNAYLLHKELKQQQQQQQQQQQKKNDCMTHKAFLEELTAQLCGVSHATNPQWYIRRKTVTHHIPVYTPGLSSGSPTGGRSARAPCKYCRMHRGCTKRATIKCKACDAHFCMTAESNCFEAWHTDRAGPPESTHSEA